LYERNQEDDVEPKSWRWAP